MVTSGKEIRQEPCQQPLIQDERVLLTAVLLLVVEHAADTVANLTLGDLDVVLGVTGLIHQGKEVVVSNVKL